MEIRVSQIPLLPPLAELAEIMSTFTRPWVLCGGWSLDAWLGRQTREHHDLDVSVLLEDQRAIFDHLAGWHLVAHDANVEHDTQEPWNGRRLEMARPGQPSTHIHATRIVRSTLDRSPLPEGGGPNLDILLNEVEADLWIVSRHHGLHLPVANATWESPLGFTMLAPEITLLHKVTEGRKRDERDFDAVLPTLSGERRAWLRGALEVAHPGHPWIVRLSDAG